MLNGFTVSIEVFGYEITKVLVFSVRERLTSRRDNTKEPPARLGSKFQSPAVLQVQPDLAHLLIAESIRKAGPFDVRRNHFAQSRKLGKRRIDPVYPKQIRYRPQIAY